jgi:hypothetical protein
MPNWSLVTADFVNNISAWPTSATKKLAELYLVDNTIIGDITFGTDIKQDTKINLKSLKALDQQFLIIDDQHISYATGVSYNDIVEGTTMLGVNVDGKFEIIGANTGYAIYFLVTQKTGLTEKAVRARVILVDN